MNSTELERILEAAVITCDRPITLKELRSMFTGRVSYDRITAALKALQDKWSGPDKGVVLVEVASGWRFQSSPDVQPYLDRLNPEKPNDLGRAALEILAIIAYRQPVTRSDIEEIRGVAVRPQSLSALEAREWVEVIGTKPTIGRPQIYATTKKFLDDLGIASLSELPELQDPDPIPAPGSLVPNPVDGSDVDSGELARFLEQRLSDQPPPGSTPST